MCVTSFHSHTCPVVHSGMFFPTFSPLPSRHMVSPHSLIPLLMDGVLCLALANKLQAKVTCATSGAGHLITCLPPSPVVPLVWPPTCLEPGCPVSLCSWGTGGVKPPWWALRDMPSEWEIDTPLLFQDTWRLMLLQHNLTHPHWQVGYRDPSLQMRYSKLRADLLRVTLLSGGMPGLHHFYYLHDHMIFNRHNSASTNFTYWFMKKHHTPLVRLSRSESESKSPSYRWWEIESQSVIFGSLLFLP